MNKAETSSAPMVTDSAAAAPRQPDTSIMSDMKSLLKVGIIHSNLITAFVGFWLALRFSQESFLDHWGVFLLVMSGSALVIAGGCILNNWYDADIDPVMKRTKNRPTVTGTIPMKVVLLMGVGTTLLGHMLLLFTTVQATLWAFLGWFTYVVLYTMWSKRRYTLNTIIGSFSGAVPPLIGWSAIDPNLHIVPAILFLIMFIWQTPHFLALAMKKCEEYRAAGVPMLPVVYGFDFTKRQIVVYIACLLPLPFLLPSLGVTFLVLATLLNLGWLFLGITGLFKKDDLKWANKIFIYSLNYLVILFSLMVIATIDFPF
ncbi:heme o synthase [Virgibacillus sp. 179-BFC.A HS]|uniref:Protoheme IX farnesyltransferase n=1 Tax=Tigheibacillus jepli TaxID=3035914 RepID=A0ABU5CKF6_9BACI|nr:heme o synthase [Virgibacillus sp. 179-BFC.A HS]MDY0405998.1 heme o synthase [Virgibacillus sp. 179-BFC.A HS]